jgi:hypothetical protein
MALRNITHMLISEILGSAITMMGQFDKSLKLSNKEQQTVKDTRRWGYPGALSALKIHRFKYLLGTQVITDSWHEIAAMR